MFKLLKEEDMHVLSNQNFTKNAMFFKDMMAFYLAYESILDKQEEKLPNFCYLHDGSICLDGVCLLMKMYASEFMFETIKLSLDYLKILYYAIANYSEDGQTVDRNKIIEEYKQYRDASIKFSEENEKNIEQKQKIYVKKHEEYNKLKLSALGHSTSAKVFNFLRIFMFVFTFMCLVVPSLLAYYHKATTLVLVIIAVGIIVVGMLFTFLIGLLCKKAQAKAEETSYLAQNKKKEKDLYYEELKAEFDKFNRIVCERYEYKNDFTDLFSKYVKHLSTKEIVSKSNVYNLLSYNMTSDIKKLFVSIQNDVNDLISRIEKTTYSENYQNDLANIYHDISKEDYFYYNSELRLHFIKKLTDFSEKSFNWKLNYMGLEIDPFSVDVRDLSREKVAFKKDRAGKVIRTSYIDFMSTKYAKNLQEIQFSGNYNSDSLKNLKTSYIKHFFNYDIAIANESEKLKEFQIAPIDINKFEGIPTYVVLKLRLLETNIGLGNSDAMVIKKIAENLFGSAIEEENNIVEFSESSIEYPNTDCQEYQDLGEAVRYVVDGKEIIGYKIK